MWSCVTALRHRRFQQILSVMVCLLSSIAVKAADPEVVSVVPYGGMVGTEATLTFAGNRLEDAEEVLCYESGLTFSELSVPEAGKGRQLTVKVAIDANSPFGVHRLRVRTRSGITKIVNFFVGPFPIVDEKEPNSEFSTPQEIAINSTIHGRIDNEDVDYFVLTAKKGERISVEVEGLRMGTFTVNNFLDPYIAVLNESRFELVAQDDHALTRQDAFVSMLAPEDGKYIVQIRDASYTGGGNYLYRLHVGNYARPSGVVPAGGKPGETVNVKLLGDPAGDFEQSVTLPAEAPLEFGVYPVQNGLVTPTMNPLQISKLDNYVEQEPNETLEQATVMAVPGAANGVLTTGEDLDYFKLTLKKDQEVDIDVVARRVRSAIDSVLDVYNAKGGRVAGDDDRKRPDSWVRYKAPADGDYYVKVRDQLGNGGPDFFYRIEVTPVQPMLELTVNEVVQYVQPDMVVPQGRRTAVLVNARRENFGGAITLEGLNLPPGVTIESPATWAGDGVMPLVFHAAPEAALAGQYSTITGTWQNPNNAEQKLTAKLIQKHLRVRSNNNQTFWEEKFDAIPVVVAEKVPFDIQVVTPKVPIVRGGTMGLKVVATKDEGFDEPIQLLVLQNPPGVNSSRSIKIEKGQTEATIPLNASGNAPLRESHIVVRAITKVGNGNVEICSPYVPITVAEKFINLKFVSTAVDQGQAIDLPVEIEQLTEFQGTATVELLSLPNKATTTIQEITKDSTQVVFPITTQADTPIGETKNLLCKVTVMQDGEPIVHMIGSGRLRVNKPAPAPVVQPKPAEPQVKKEEQPKPKVLSRLEMLRQQQSELRQQMNN